MTNLHSFVIFKQRQNYWSAFAGAEHVAKGVGNSAVSAPRYPPSALREGDGAYRGGQKAPVAQKLHPFKRNSAVVATRFAHSPTKI